MNSVNSPAKNMRAIGRIAEAAILHGLCPKGMGVSVKIEINFRTWHKLTQRAGMLCYYQQNTRQTGIYLQPAWFLKACKN
jgi:hypothetical protein